MGRARLYGVLKGTWSRSTLSELRMSLAETGLLVYVEAKQHHKLILLATSSPAKCQAAKTRVWVSA